MVAAGEILGPYEIQRRIRGGGMATLYLARRSGAAGFARHLAIKVVNEDLAHDEAFVRMFIDEAKLACHINHPNVVHVEDFGEANGSYFIAMEYVDGCSLAQLTRVLAKQKRRLSPDLAVYITLEVAEGLHAAHEATDERRRPLNVVHRDVNPANILLAFKGHVKLIDFGIAKSTGRAHQTKGGSLKGKFRYMSPEQALGKPIDRRADVYALGITLWETLTARRLFDADSDVGILETVRAPQVVPPSHFAQGVTPALDEVVMAALAPDRDARIRTALELRQRLAQVMPAAAILDATRLSSLLTAVMRDEIERRRTELPESVSGVDGAAGDDVPDQEVLRTMTVSGTDIEVSADSDSGLGAGSGADAEGSGPEAPIAAAPRTSTGAVDEALVPVRPLRLPLLLGAGVLGLALLLVFIALAVRSSSEGGSDTAAASPPTEAPQAATYAAVGQTEEAVVARDAGPTTAEAEPPTGGDTVPPVTPDEGQNAGETSVATGSAGTAGVAAVGTRPAMTATTATPRMTSPRMTSPRMTSPRMTSPRMTPTMMTGGAPVLVDDVF